MALRTTQVINLAGYISMRMVSIRWLAINATDNSLTEEQRQRSAAKAREEIQEVAKLVRTAIVRNDYTLPTDEFTDEEMERKGIN